MANRSVFARIAGLMFVLILGAAGLVVYSAALAARALVANLAVNLLAASLEYMAQYINLMAAIEFLTAIGMLATRGPVLTAAWAWSRVVFWRGG